MLWVTPLPREAALKCFDEAQAVLEQSLSTATVRGTQPVTTCVVPHEQSVYGRRGASA